MGDADRWIKHTWRQGKYLRLHARSSLLMVNRWPMENSTEAPKLQTATGYAS